MNNTKETYKQFNVKELIDKSNLKIERWLQWIKPIGDAELKYISTETFDIYIKGIHLSTKSNLKTLMSGFVNIHGSYEKGEYLSDFEKEFDCIPGNIICLGTTPKDSTKIDGIIKARYLLTDYDFNRYRVNDYNIILNRLYYKEQILVLIRTKEYKPVTYV